MDPSDISAPESCTGLARPTSTVGDEASQWDSSEEIAERLQGRLKDLQEFVCYLLRKNEELRMEVFARRERMRNSTFPQYHESR
jgi:hypothetical protein